MGDVYSMRVGCGGFLDVHHQARWRQWGAVWTYEGVGRKEVVER